MLAATSPLLALGRSLATTVKVALVCWWAHVVWGHVISSPTREKKQPTGQHVQLSRRLMGNASSVTRFTILRISGLWNKRASWTSARCSCGLPPSADVEILWNRAFEIKFLFVRKLLSFSLLSTLQTSNFVYVCLQMTAWWLFGSPQPCVYAKTITPTSK